MRSQALYMKLLELDDLTLKPAGISLAQPLVQQRFSKLFSALDSESCICLCG